MKRTDKRRVTQSIELDVISLVVLADVSAFCITATIKWPMRIGKCTDTDRNDKEMIIGIDDICIFSESPDKWKSARCKSVERKQEDKVRRNLISLTILPKRFELTNEKKDSE